MSGQFEFNDEYLLYIAKNLTTCKYGTFFFNNEFERQNSQIRDNTVSIFADIHLKKDKEFRNPYYVGSKYLARLTRIPVTAHHKLRVWKEFYYRYQFDFDLISVNNRQHAL